MLSERQKEVFANIFWDEELCSENEICEKIGFNCPYREKGYIPKCTLYTSKKWSDEEYPEFVAKCKEQVIIYFENL